MKFILTESKMENIIFKYLDNRDFFKIEKDNVVYFVNSVDDKYSQIIYNKNNEVCYIYYKLVDEISSLFSMEKFDSEKVIGKWVESTLQMRVSNTYRHSQINARIVESTLQMRVSNTPFTLSSIADELKVPYK